MAGGSVSGNGIYGVSSSGIGVRGEVRNENGWGGFFRNTASSGRGSGVVGWGSGTVGDVIQNKGWSGGGEFIGQTGVIGATDRIGGIGVLAYNGGGSYALYAIGTTWVDGSARVLGQLSVNGNLDVTGTKNFVIDHPLDPTNRILRHAAIESSEVLNVYSGVVVCEADGTATVTLSEWMEALNRDFRYQLTTIGGYAPVYVATKLANSQFTIAGGTAGLEVSWQLTGVRNDAYMRANPFEVESDKAPDEVGGYLAPEAFGEPPRQPGPPPSPHAPG